MQLTTIQSAILCVASILILFCVAGILIFHMGDFTVASESSTNTSVDSPWIAVYGSEIPSDEARSLWLGSHGGDTQYDALNKGRYMTEQEHESFEEFRKEMLANIYVVFPRR